MSKNRWLFRFEDFVIVQRIQDEQNKSGLVLLLLARVLYLVQTMSLNFLKSDRGGKKNSAPLSFFLANRLKLLSWNKSKIVSSRTFSLGSPCLKDAELLLLNRSSPLLLCIRCLFFKLPTSCYATSLRPQWSIFDAGMIRGTRRFIF